MRSNSSRETPPRNGASAASGSGASAGPGVSSVPELALRRLKASRLPAALAMVGADPEPGVVVAEIVGRPRREPEQEVADRRKDRRLARLVRPEDDVEPGLVGAAEVEGDVLEDAVALQVQPLEPHGRRLRPRAGAGPSPRRRPGCGRTAPRGGRRARLRRAAAPEALSSPRSSAARIASASAGSARTRPISSRTSASAAESACQRLLLRLDLDPLDPDVGARLDGEGRALGGEALRVPGQGAVRRAGAPQHQPDRQRQPSGVRHRPVDRPPDPRAEVLERRGAGDVDRDRRPAHGVHRDVLDALHPPGLDRHEAEALRPGLVDVAALQVAGEHDVRDRWRGPRGCGRGPGPSSRTP